MNRAEGEFPKWFPMQSVARGFLVRKEVAVEHALRGVVKKGDRFVVRVVGYDVERTVKPAALRPRAASS